MINNIILVKFYNKLIIFRFNISFRLISILIQSYLMNKPIVQLIFKIYFITLSLNQSKGKLIKYDPLYLGTRDGLTCYNYWKINEIGINANGHKANINLFLRPFIFTLITYNRD